ncbi:MAG: hypothetical protein M3314_07555 [Actinomycetota bacterium]|nr:hypothetical protein [Actinomycetota bacterium]
MEPVEGSVFGVFGPDALTPPRVVFVDPKAQEFRWVPTVGNVVRSPWWMLYDGIARSWDFLGDIPVGIEWPSEWQTLRADFDRIAADFHRCVQLGPHPPEQGTLFETAES